MKIVKLYSSIIVIIGLLSINTSCSKKSKDSYTCVTYLGNSDVVYGSSVAYDCNSCFPSTEQFPVSCVPNE